MSCRPSGACRAALGAALATAIAATSLGAQTAVHAVADRHAAPTHASAPSTVTAAKKPLTEVTIEREVYDYAGAGRRDPFRSLMTTTVLRPALAELRLVAVAYDPAGASVAILRDVNSKQQHRVRVGTPLGRMRVAAIRQKAVVFTIEELGYSRQETLALSDSTAVRSK